MIRISEATVIRRLLATLLSVALLLPVFTLGPIVTRTLAVGAVGCENVIGQSYHSGVTSDPYHFTTVRGVHATIWSRARMDRCTDPAVWAQTGAYAWIALVPAPGNAYRGSNIAIMQVGTIRCFDINTMANDPCDSGNENETWPAYAIGGCTVNGITYNPEAKILGSFPADSGGIVYDIRRNAAGGYTISYTGTYHSASIDVSGSDPAIACWLTGTGDNASAQYNCERGDNGDACGFPLPNPVGFRDIRIQKSVGGQWFYPGQVISGTQYGFTMGDANCYVTLAEDHCDVRTDLQNPPDDIDVWTTN